MSRTITQEIIIPAEQARAFAVKKGQILRIIEIEGKQVGDVAIFNLYDYKEVYHAGHTYNWNCLEGIGDDKRITKLYSKPPRSNVMFTVIEDKVGVHWCWSGTKCSEKTYEFKGVKGYHKNCQDNIAEAIRPYGLTPDDVPDVFNVFMNVDMDENGCHVIKTPVSKKGDYIDLLAEMDCLVAISACPSNYATNDYKPKSLKVEIWQ